MRARKTARDSAAAWAWQPQAAGAFARVCALAGALAGAAPALAQEGASGAPPSPEATAAAAEAAAAPVAARPANRPCRPGYGCVTDLPLPRFVSLKTGEGNARRGPGLTHRIDWIFTRAGMPLMITAEFEHWRRVEDAEGAGGWVHYSLLSGARSVMVTTDMAELRVRPDPQAEVVAQAETGVVGRVVECAPDWCRISASGTRGWLPKAALWGVVPGEVIE
jgi:SH3-like domain-containing protein